MAEYSLNGWLFDVYPSGTGMTLWFIDQEERHHVAWRPYAPHFFMRIDEKETGKVAALVAGLPFAVTLDRAVQREIYSNEEWELLRVTVHDSRALRTTVQRLERHFPYYAFYNSDIPAQQLFLYETGLFPLALGEYRFAENHQLLDWDLHDSREAIDYSTPPLTTLTLRNRPDVVSPKYRKRIQCEVEYEGNTYALEGSEPEEILDGLNRHLLRHDPDIILTEYGDGILMPLLADIARTTHVTLLLNRDASSGYMTTQESSYFTYGKIVHKEGAFELAGRWHIDIKNSFMMEESSLDGVIEIARLTQLPIQRQSRASIGTALSSMQLSWAYRNGILIPAKKREPEEFKSAETLLMADRGGLIFQPTLGFHEQVGELDFVSMYPTIMVEHNVSPETVNCRCCNNNAVPELGYTICEKREGIVPATLRPVVKKRSEYKKLKKQMRAIGDPRWKIYDRRQTALKWMLVTCFGYLGYKNARFGRIEAHESVNAFSRDAILQAKEIAEQHGFQFLHAIVDCMWLKRPGATEAEYEALADEVSEAAGIPISLEGIYNWILFPSSKTDPLLPTANRYVGWYTNNEIKIRGIEVRRRDTPVFVKRLQGEMLQIMGRAQNVGEIAPLVPALLQKLREHLLVLRGGNANPLDLVIRRHLTQEADEYTTNTVNAIVAKSLEEAGVHLAAGEMIEYILVDATGKKTPEKGKPLALYAFEDGYDIEKYTELCLKSAETLLLPLGYDYRKLQSEFGVLPEKKLRPRRPKKHDGQGTLFDL